MAAEENTQNQGSADGAGGNQAPDTTTQAPDNDAEITPAAEMANAGGDPSNTYENGPAPRAISPGVNQAVPEGAEVIADYQAGLDAGYIGYAPGTGSHEAMGVAAAGARNDRLRASVVNAAQGSDKEAKTSKTKTK